MKLGLSEREIEVLTRYARVTLIPFTPIDILRERGTRSGVPADVALCPGGLDKPPFPDQKNETTSSVVNQVPGDTRV